MSNKQALGEIMTRLGETEAGPRAQIQRALKLLGVEAIQALVAEAEATEAQGGLLLPNGRHRTLGGIFFYLLRTRATPEQYKALFPQHRKAKRVEPALIAATRDQIAGTLQITKPRDHATIERMLQACGVQPCVDALGEATQIEAQGGITDPQGHRSSPMGVWLRCLKPRAGLSPNQWRAALQPPEAQPTPSAPGDVPVSPVSSEPPAPTPVSPQLQQLVTMIIGRFGTADDVARQVVERALHQHGAEAGITALRAVQRSQADPTTTHSPLDVWLAAIGPIGASATPPSLPATPVVAQSQSNAVLTWDNRGNVVRASVQHPGKASTVKVTIIGRPDGMIERQNVVVTTLMAAKPPALPKGLPVPPVPATPYTIYLATKQRAKVQAVIDNPEDALIVEGFGSYDPQVQGIAVFATNVTTKLMQREKFAQQQAAPADQP